MAQLTPYFTPNSGEIQLEKTVFRSFSGFEFICVRGKTSGAYQCSGSFQWTPAVKAVCVLFLQALSRSFGTVDNIAPMISGRRGSLATSLDYAIDKEPQWLCDMFGLDESGKTNLRRLVFRSNSGSKRPGPVSLSLNKSALPAKNITVLVDSTLVHNQLSLDSIIAILSNESLEPIKSPISTTYTQLSLTAIATAG